MKTASTVFVFILLLSTHLASSQPSYLALYNFSGNGNDASGNGYNGTLHGNATITSDLNTGDNGSDYFSIPNATVNGLTDFTISFRFKLNSIHLSGAFPGNTFLHAWGGDSNQDGLKISIDGPNNEFQVSINTVERVGIYQFVAGTWYRAKIIRSGSTLMMYIDQNLIASFSNVSTSPIQAVSNGVVLGQEEDCLGGCFAQNQSMNGSLGRLAVLNFAQFRQESNSAINGEQPVEIFPNPASNQMSIAGAFEDGKNYIVDFVSVNGQIISNEIIANSSSLNVTTATLPSGIYFVRVKDNNSVVASGKMIVQH